jgi:glycine/D-amino acid oxidase-like deaminating enzyme
VSGDARRILVVGGGIVGTQVALAASLRGHEVTLIDRHHSPHGASSANLGAVRLSGRAEGDELEMAIYGRTRWEAISKRVPAVGFTPSGSITLLRDEREIAHAETYADAHRDSLEVRVIRGRDISSWEPAIAGSFPAAMICTDDAWIRPGEAVPALIEYLRSAETVTVRLGHELLGLDDRASAIVAVTSGARIHADHVFVCPGPDIPAPLQDAAAAWPTAMVRLHAVELAAHGAAPQRLVTDASAFGFYPGYSDGWTDDGRPEWVVARSDRRTLLVGIHRTRAEQQADNAYQDDLSARTAEVFGGIPQRPLRAWSAVVLDHQDGPFLDVDWSPSVTVITGLGLRGNTLAPAIAHAAVARLG